MLTNCRILEHDEKTGVVPPFNLEPPVLILKLNKSTLDVLCLELFGEARQREDASDRGRETRKVGSHGN